MRAFLMAFIAFFALISFAPQASAQRGPDGGRFGQVEVPPQCINAQGNIVCAVIPKNSTNIQVTVGGICAYVDNTSNNDYFVLFQQGSVDSFLLAVERLSVPGVSGDPCCPSRELPITASNGNVFNITLPVGRDFDSAANGEFLNRSHTFQLTRQDCNTDSPPGCNAIAWTETYTGTAICDARSWSWSSGPRTQDEPPDFNPPPSQQRSCGTNAHNSVFTQYLRTDSRAANAQECPFGAGTRVRSADIFGEFRCTNGTATRTSTPEEERNVQFTGACQNRVNGDCGAANGVVYNSTPPANQLCDIDFSAGGPVVTGNAFAGFAWQCVGSGGGETAQCRTGCAYEDFSGSWVAGSNFSNADSNTPNAARSDRYRIQVSANNNSLNVTVTDTAFNQNVAVTSNVRRLSNGTLIGYFFSTAIEFTVTVAPDGNSRIVALSGRSVLQGGCNLTPSPAFDVTCGQSNGQVFETRPDFGLCSSGGLSTGLVETQTGWSWFCYDDAGNSSSICSANRPTPEPATCGTATGAFTPVAPVSGLCGTGSTASEVTGTCSSGFSWTCNRGNQIIICNTPVPSGAPGTGPNTCPLPPQNGVCGSAQGSLVSTAPAVGLCAQGSPTAVEGDCVNGFTWVCTGQNNGVPAQCATVAGNGRTTVVDGQTVPFCPSQRGPGTCGAANGQLTPNAPTSGLCGSGSASAVSGSCGSGFSWTCRGTNGVTAQCSTPAGTGRTTPINGNDAAYCPSERQPGACGSANAVLTSSRPEVGLCGFGQASAVSGSCGTGFSWTCLGTNGTPTSCATPAGSGRTTTINGNVAAFCPAERQPASCGAANGVLTANAPTSGLCGAGSASSVSGNCADGFSWTCLGTDGARLSCASPAGRGQTTPINGNNAAYCPSERQPGVCGSANGGFSGTAPSSGLCSFGSASGVGGSCEGGFSWTCLGSNGTPTQCASLRGNTQPAVFAVSPQDGGGNPNNVWSIVSTTADGDSLVRLGLRDNNYWMAGCQAFDRTFEFDVTSVADIQRFRINAVGWDDLYTLFVNGQVASQGPYAHDPSSPGRCDLHQSYYLDLSSWGNAGTDLRPYLQPGRNVIVLRTWVGGGGEGWMDFNIAPFAPSANGGSGNFCPREPIHGACGSANGTFTALQPTGAPLCAAGTATPAVGSCAGGFTWTCQGFFGGNPAFCSTPAGSSNQCDVTPGDPNPNQLPGPVSVNHGSDPLFVLTDPWMRPGRGVGPQVLNYVGTAQYLCSRAGYPHVLDYAGFGWFGRFKKHSDVDFFTTSFAGNWGDAVERLQLSRFQHSFVQGKDTEDYGPMQSALCSDSLNVFVPSVESLGSAVDDANALPQPPAGMVQCPSDLSLAGQGAQIFEANANYFGTAKQGVSANFQELYTKVAASEIWADGGQGANPFTPAVCKQELSCYQVVQHTSGGDNCNYYNDHDYGRNYYGWDYYGYGEWCDPTPVTTTYELKVLRCQPTTVTPVTGQSAGYSQHTPYGGNVGGYDITPSNWWDEFMGWGHSDLVNIN